MFKTRLISGILLVIAALLTIISGNYVLFVTLLCVSLLGMQELYKAMGVHKDQTEFLELAGYLVRFCIMYLCCWDLNVMERWRF